MYIENLQADIDADDLNIFLTLPKFNNLTISGRVFENVYENIVVENIRIDIDLIDHENKKIGEMNVASLLGKESLVYDQCVEELTYEYDRLKAESDCDSQEQQYGEVL